MTGSDRLNHGLKNTCLPALAGFESHRVDPPPSPQSQAGPPLGPQTEVSSRGIPAPEDDEDEEDAWSLIGLPTHGLDYHYP